MIEPEEARVAPRKVLKVRSRVIMQNGPTLQGKTLDISISGICVMVDGPIPAGHLCMIIFDTLIKGIPKQVSATAKAVYSICGKEGFRTGFQFSQLTPANATVISGIVAS